MAYQVQAGTSYQVQYHLNGQPPYDNINYFSDQPASNRSFKHFDKVDSKAFLQENQVGTSDVSVVAVF